MLNSPECFEPESEAEMAGNPAKGIAATFLRATLDFDKNCDTLAKAVCGELVKEAQEMAALFSQPAYKLPGDAYLAATVSEKQSSDHQKNVNAKWEIKLRFKDIKAGRESSGLTVEVETESLSVFAVSLRQPDGQPKLVRFDGFKDFQRTDGYKALCEALAKAVLNDRNHFLLSGQATPRGPSVS